MYLVLLRLSSLYKQKLLLAHFAVQFPILFGRHLVEFHIPYGFRQVDSTVV